MTNKGRERALAPAKKLKRAFECAVQDISQVSLTGKVSRYRTPIVQRVTTTASKAPVDAEKQALSDAARALAQLWKVSPSSSRS